MRVGIVVDASCDLPRTFVREQGIHVLPNVLSFGGKRFVDVRDPDETMHLYRRLIANKSVAGSSDACAVEQIRDLFLAELVTEYDRVLVITPGAARNEVFNNATEASYAILQSYRERRESAGRSGAFALRILDSGSVAAGHALLACRAVSATRTAAAPFEKVRSTLKDEAGRIRTLVVPNDLFYLRDRGLGAPGDALGAGTMALARLAQLLPVLAVSGTGSRPVARARGFQAAASAALEQAREAVRAGLGAPLVMLSFGGDPRIIRDLPAYQDLEAQAASQRVELHLAVMSASMGVRLGPGALSVAWLGGEPHP